MHSPLKTFTLLFWLIVECGRATAIIRACTLERAVLYNAIDVACFDWAWFLFLHLGALLVLHFKAVIT